MGEGVWRGGGYTQRLAQLFVDALELSSLFLMAKVFGWMATKLLKGMDWD